MANIGHVDVRAVLCAIPGAGYGYRAVDIIPRGTVVLEETPLFVVRPGEDTIEGIQAELRRIATTSYPLYQQFLNLTASHQFLVQPDGLNRGRFLTNALPCGSSAGLFLKGARFNSSCRPNVHYNWLDGRRVMQFRAMKDIQLGEELCIAYDIDGLLEPRETRQATIQRTSGFRCICPACILPARGDTKGVEMQIFSDNTRTWLNSIILQNADPTIGNLRQNMDNICDALQALDREGLYYHRDTFFYHGYRVAVAAGDGNNAMLWLASAHDSAAAIVGLDDPRVIKMAYTLSTHTPASFGMQDTMRPPPLLLS